MCRPVLSAVETSNRSSLIASRTHTGRAGKVKVCTGELDSVASLAAPSSCEWNSDSRWMWTSVSQAGIVEAGLTFLSTNND